MRSPIYLRLDPADEFNFIDFIVDQSNGRPVDLSMCGVFQIDNPQYYFKEMFLNEIVEHGLTTYLEMDLILEDLTTPRTPQDRIEEILVKFLTNIGVDDELIIIDPYFFAPNIDASYVTRLCNIITPFLSRLQNLKIVTASHSRAYSPSSKALIMSGLSNLSSSLNVNHSQSNELHDRFWISNKREKGILTGTSLNGIGRKYAVIDYLQDIDVKDIVSEFSCQNLI